MVDNVENFLFAWTVIAHFERRCVYAACYGVLKNEQGGS